MPVGCDQITVVTAWPDPEAVDLAGKLRLRHQDRIAQRVPFQEIIGQLIERAVEVIVDARISFEHADQDFAVEALVAIEREAGALADDDAVGVSGIEKLIRDLDGLVEDVVKHFELPIEYEEEAHRGFIEDRPQENLIGRQRTFWRPNLRQIVQLEYHILGAVGDAVHKWPEFLDLNAATAIEYF